MSKEKEKTQEMIYAVFAPTPQADIDALGFGPWLEQTAEKIREEFETKKVFISVLGLTVYLISQNVSSDAIDQIGFNRWFGVKRRSIGEYFGVDSRSIYIKAV